MRFLYSDIWGKAKGDFNPTQAAYSSGNHSEKFLDVARKKDDINLIFAPRCDFTTKIVALGENDDKVNDWLVRTKEPADGGIIEEPGQAVAFFNGDCPIVALFDRSKGRLAVLHAGFRCLVPNTRNPRSIIRVAFEDHSFDPKSTEVFVGYGIGPCCYGAKHWPEMKDFTLSLTLPVGQATRGLSGRPKGRYGEKSIDLYRLILNQLEKVGVPEGNVQSDLTCTSCAKEQSAGIADFAYYSYCRGNQGRNAALAWYVDGGDPTRNFMGTIFQGRDSGD